MSVQQFMEALLGKLPEFFENEDELRAMERTAYARNRCRGLLKKAPATDQLAEMRRIIEVEKSDLSTAGMAESRLTKATAKRSWP